MIVALYRLRWQVELVFKRWKSILHLDRLPNFRPDTVLTWLLTKILLTLLLDRIASDAPEQVVETTGDEALDAASCPDARQAPPLPCAPLKPERAIVPIGEARCVLPPPPPTPASASRASTPSAKRPLSREPWKLTRLLWPILIAAILPLSLAQALPKIGALTARLEATTSTSRRLPQREAFRTRQLDAAGNERRREEEPELSLGERGS